MTNVYIPVLHQRRLKTPGKLLLLPDLPVFVSVKWGVGYVDSKAEVRSTVVAHRGEGWAGDGCSEHLDCSVSICLSLCPFRRSGN